MGAPAVIGAMAGHVDDFHRCGPSFFHGLLAQELGGEDVASR